MTARRSSDTIPHVKLYFAIFGASIVGAAACGARTGLDVPIPPEHEQDAGPDVLDAGPDVFDAPPDVFDAPPDVFDAPPDAPVVNDCQDAGGGRFSFADLGYYIGAGGYCLVDGR